MVYEQQEILTDLYNLMLDPGTRDFERQQLSLAKDQLESGRKINDVLGQLEFSLRPLALRQNLSPNMADFYDQIITKQKRPTFDASHYLGENDASTERAIFAGGCFWCMVDPFDSRPGIKSVISGYIGGNVDNPTYDAVSQKQTGHVEAVEIVYDRNVISYNKLLEIYWQLIDPTDDNGQFLDRGSNYRAGIFVQDDEQLALAEASKEALAASGRYHKPIVTPIKQAGKFWPAENYHQEYYQKNPKKYRNLKRSRSLLQTLFAIKNKLFTHIKS